MSEQSKAGANMDALLQAPAKKIRKKSLRIPGPSNASVNILRKMANGMQLTAIRTHPREWHYRLGWSVLSPGEIDPNADELAPGTVTALIQANMISAGRTKSTDDFLRYAITPTGTSRLASTPVPDDSQVDWTVSGPGAGTFEGGEA